MRSVLGNTRTRVTRFGNAVRLVWAVQWKTGFPVIYAMLAVITVVALRATPLEAYRELLLPAMQLGEYGTLALMLVAAHRYIENSEKSDLALLVTPLRRGEYVAALALGSALLPTSHPWLCKSRLHPIRWARPSRRRPPC